MTGTISIDTSKLEQFNRGLLNAIRISSIPIVAEVHRKQILGLTSEGVDAFGEVFQPYSPPYAKVRAKKNLGTDVKNLRVTGGLLDGIALEGDTLAPRGSNSKGTDYQTIASGQMTGAGGRWSYTHHFFDVSEETNEMAGGALTRELNYIIGKITQ